MKNTPLGLASCFVAALVWMGSCGGVVAFEDSKLFPAGTVEFDCALLMRNIEHEWHGRPTLCAESVCTTNIGSNTTGPATF